MLFSYLRQAPAQSSRLKWVAVNEAPQNRQEVPFIRIVPHLGRLVHRILTVAQEIDKPLV